MTVRPLRSCVALRSTRVRGLLASEASALISARSAETCLRRRSGVDGFKGARRAGPSRSNRLLFPPAPRSGRPGFAGPRPRASRRRALAARTLARWLRSGAGSSRTIRPASKLASASLASFTPSWSRSTRVRTSMTSPSGRSPSSNGPNETRIRRFTARPRCSRIFLISRFFPFPQAQGEPGVCALLAVELGLDAEIVDAVNRDPAHQADRAPPGRCSRARAPGSGAASRSTAAPEPARGRRRW